MKKTCSILAAMLLTAGVFAQPPQSMSYQAVIRNSSDALVTDTQVGMQISILQGSESGTAVYAETQTPKTSANGLVSLEIGTGEPVSGTFSGIDWAAGPYFVKTETDPDGGTNYTIAGTSQLLSVPYALHARNVEIEADGDATNELQKITISGSVLTLDKNGGSVTLPTGGTEGDNWGTQTVVTDATLTGSGTAATPLKIADNGVNSGKIADGSVSTADLANSAVTSPKLSAMGAASGQVLKWSGTAWAPGNDNIGGFALPYVESGSTTGNTDLFFITNTGSGRSIRAVAESNTAIRGVTNTGFAGVDGQSNTGIGVYGRSGSNYGVYGLSNTGHGVFGKAESETGDVKGGWFESSSEEGTGVYGFASATSGETVSYGGYFESKGPNGRGVHGLGSGTGSYGGYFRSNSHDGIGVYGYCAGVGGGGTGVMGYTYSNIGETYGGKFESRSNVGTGVSGYASSSGDGPTYGGSFESKSRHGRGVYGLASNTGDAGSNIGGMFESRGERGKGVFGSASSTSGPTYGGHFISYSSEGTGVVGSAEASTGETYGGSFESKSASGRGVYGVASATDGTNYGGYFISNSPSGKGVYGKASATSGTTYGGIFECFSTSGTAVRGTVYTSSGRTYGGYFQSASTNGRGVSGNAYAQSGYTYGGTFGSDSPDGTGVYGYAGAETGNNYGGYFLTYSTTGIGVYGEANATSGINYGVYGKTLSSEGYAGYFKGRFYNSGLTRDNTDLFYVTNTGTGRAIHAVAESNTAVWGSSTSGYAAVDGRNSSGKGVSGHSATNYGVYGHSDENYGVFGHSGLTGGRFEGISIGMDGRATGTSGINYGVIGRTSSSSGYAGYFEGRVHITGNLSKGGGSFEIDHPLDPANKILRHSFVESPDMMNVYNGNIITDGNGRAEVLLPDYFEALNVDFRYQLTVIGEFAQAIVAEEISSNRFTICTDKPNVKVSWQVTGVRTDPYAIENRIVVEEYKSPELQGCYLHPLPYGQPETRSIEYARNPELMSIVE